MTGRLLLALAALGALLLGAGCGERGAPAIPEMDEPFYIQGVQLNKQGRSGEALTSFLKVIDKRGERGAAESHLEAGVIYLNHTKEPVLAYYHFKRYLELQANSKEAPRVRGMLDAALRDVARRFPGRPADDQSGRLAAAEEITKLRRDNDELRAELQTLRGGGAVMPGRGTGRMVALPDEARANPPPSAPPVTVADTPIIPAPSTPAPRPALNTAPAVTPIAPQPAPSTAVASRGTPATRPPASQAQRPVPMVSAAQQSRTAPVATGRTHTVKQGEGLFAIARRYDPQNPGKKLREILEANREALPGGTNSPLKPGMTLRIP